ncbi:aromatic/alkene monooxygenase hydroxylase subunit beta [Panacagrimonas sp.]|uniref:aromatic/alkene monooxygenase hydroxylase subunit beta n=1 Tax=Panacagrimonas sp. TaxID=2480088 RepID=UPI003B52C1A7
MQIDLKTVNVKALRNTFANVADRIGGDKQASRYQEATMGMQPDVNFHYRPTWDPDHEIFDPARTAIKMKDWYALKDPRQLYYGNWTMGRARQQDAMESNFNFVETRGLITALPDEVRDISLRLLVPLRHVAWGANMNNSSMCAYGYGTAITAPCSFHAMDQLGIAQYLTRLGLLLADVEQLDAAKQAWLNAPEWQELRRYVEDSFVVQDWFELFVAQNLALDGLLYPLIYGSIVDDYLAARNGSAIAMLTQFMTEWHDETSRWVEAQIKVAAAESPENKALLQQWITHWRDRAAVALAPLVKAVLPAEWAGDDLEQAITQFNARCAKAGVIL